RGAFYYLATKGLSASDLVQFPSHGAEQHTQLFYAEQGLFGRLDDEIDQLGAAVFEPSDEAKLEFDWTNQKSVLVTYCDYELMSMKSPAFLRVDERRHATVNIEFRLDEECPAVEDRIEE
ncbi:MAG: hypothetical protein AAF527_12135, partial [Pseudomonadota bacterium]